MLFKVIQQAQGLCHRGKYSLCNIFQLFFQRWKHILHNPNFLHQHFFDFFLCHLCIGLPIFPCKGLQKVMCESAGIGIRKADLHRFPQGKTLAQKVRERTFNIAFQSGNGAPDHFIFNKQSLCHFRRQCNVGGNRFIAAVQRISY